MAWIWSDELAAAAEAAGLEHSELARWKRQPVAFARRSDEPASDLARSLLGIEAAPAPKHDVGNGDGDTTPVCACDDARAAQILAPDAATA